MYLAARSGSMHRIILTHSFPAGISIFEFPCMNDTFLKFLSLKTLACLSLTGVTGVSLIIRYGLFLGEGLGLLQGLLLLSRFWRIGVVNSGETKLRSQILRSLESDGARDGGREKDAPLAGDGTRDAGKLWLTNEELRSVEGAEEQVDDKLS